ncbi:MAG: hypothetical protein L3I91_02165 [Mycoplasma sp.]
MKTKLDLSQIVDTKLTYQITSSQDLEDLLIQINKQNKVNISFNDVILTKRTKDQFVLYAANSSKQFKGKLIVNYKLKRHLGFKLFLSIVTFVLYSMFAVIIPLGLKESSSGSKFSFNNPLILTGIIAGGICFFLLVILISKYPMGMNNKQKEKFRNKK